MRPKTWPPAPPKITDIVNQTELLEFKTFLLLSSEAFSHSWRHFTVLLVYIFTKLCLHFDRSHKSINPFYPFWSTIYLISLLCWDFFFKLIFYLGNYLKELNQIDCSRSTLLTFLEKKYEDLTSNCVQLLFLQNNSPQTLYSELVPTKVSTLRMKMIFCFCFLDHPICPWTTFTT